MSKKKIVTACLVVALLATGLIGGSLAYFTDKDSKTNSFTVGNVSIDLQENYTQNSELVPTTGKDAEGNWTNAVEKEVFVVNDGSKDAYVRVHIAIPQVLDNGDPSFDAAQNVLHFNYDPASVGEGKWDWSKSTGTPFEGDFNFYTTTINKVAYNVYVVTYDAALAKGATTVNAMDQVYLDWKVTNEDITRISKMLNNNWNIYVAAEGVQTDGFEDAYTALNTSFGTPGAYEVDWTTVAGL